MNYTTERLKRHLSREGVNKNGFYREVGVSSTMVNKILAGEKKPSEALQKRMSDVMDEYNTK